MKYKEEQSAWEVGATCHWNQAWSKELSELTCELTYCTGTFTIPESYLVGQNDVMPQLGEVKELRCPPNAKLLEPTTTKEQARGGFNVPCRSDGTCQEHEDWMACRYTVFCPPAALPPVDGHRTFLTNGVKEVWDTSGVQMCTRVPVPAGQGNNQHLHLGQDLAARG